MTDNSDYDKDRIKLHEQLPDVYQSETSKVLFENLFNRFLTKNETKRVAGYIGKGVESAIVKRQIQEPTLHRQAFQLQPILTSKIGSVEHMASWQDLLNEIERLGIDVTRLPEWGKVLQFNWAPPIDIDKLINFQDYYWYDETSPNSRPEYITIRNRCASAEAYVNFWKRLLDEYDPNEEGIVISELLDTGTAGSPIEFNTFVFEGEYSRLFEPGFEMYVRNSSNPQLNKQVFTVASFTYDDENNVTYVVTNESVTDGTLGGAVVSLSEQYAVSLVTRDCQCNNGALGWDSLQWDDNPANPLWDNGTIDHEIWLASITNTVDPTNGDGTDGDLWFNETTDILYEKFDGTWALIMTNFSTTLSNTTGTSLWDEGDCGTGATITSALQWINTNKWIHKTDVPNFTIAKKAQFPIIEFSAELELNEWTYVNHLWKYRAGTFASWEDSVVSPGLIELIYPFDNYESYSGNVYKLSADYGDQTSWFVEGKQVRTDNSGSPSVIPQVLTVVRSYFATDVAASPTNSEYHTFVEFDQSISGSPLPALIPMLTANGDIWRDYDTHWVYQGTTDTLPINHQLENPLVVIDSTLPYTSTTDYEFVTNYYAQNFITKTNIAQFVLQSSLRRRALIGFDDVRVYVNNVRQYGTYEEISEADASLSSDTEYVAGILFSSEFIPTIGSEIRIEVGEAATSDLGWASVNVRISEESNQKQNVSLIKYRKLDQIKTNINQYPVFDLYNVDGTPAHIASPIFTYQTSPDAPLQPALGVRLVMDSTIRNYGFVQHLITNDNGTLYAYKDYTNQENMYWFNTLTNKLYIWNGLNWDTRFYNDNNDDIILVEPTIGYTMPDSSDIITGLINHLWYDTTTQKLYRRIASGNNIETSWLEITNIVIAPYDQSLQTVWKKGLNNEEYIPAKVDWQNRTEEEYISERELFEQETADELVLAGMSQQDAEEEASSRWLSTQSNTHSTSGEWVGDWEIPDPLYFNNQHENKQIVSYREVVTHFNSIINSQPKIPGYAGPKTSMFHLLSPEDINYGLGGKIKEFNDGFDTFLSSIFVNNVTPLRLIEFARDQYQSLTNSLSETYRRQLLTLLTNTSEESLADITTFISNTIIEEHEQSDNVSLIYGDSTTFTEIDGNADIGLRNWIATLPYFNLVGKQKPQYLIDDILNINEIRHHDNHLNMYNLPSNVIETLSRAITNVPDTRVNDTFGRISSNLPPNNTSEFESLFSTDIENRHGVYWYYVPTSGNRILYRLTILNASSTEPSTSEDGQLWLDTGTDTLRIRNGSSWNVVSGLAEGDGRLHNGSNPANLLTATISAWQPVDFNEILNNIILTAEQELFSNIPTRDMPYDVNDTLTSNLSLSNEYLEEEFLTYALKHDITTPLRNTDYSNVDPWTWNYKFSSITNYPGSENTNESGGYWKDLYQKIYGTPYPHLEPWKLQTYVSKPDWWDEEYADTSGNRRWLPIMWANIRDGIIPAGKDYPNNVTSILGIPTGSPSDSETYLLQVPTLPTWTYFSVNVSGSPLTLGDITYNPDDLLPPYWNYSGPPANVRSLYTNISQIVSPGADYSFNDAGPVEWNWRNSIAYNYALMTVSFRIDPIRFVTHTFGKTFLNVAGLQIDADTNNTFSHTRTSFHGEVVNEQPYLINGTNQWYVNINRYFGFDSSYSNFRSLWTNWTAPLTYQLSSFIDTQSFILGHRTVDVSSFDWNITSKSSFGTEDYWYDAFTISLIEMPPPVARYNNEAQWLFSLNTNLPISRTISYYDIKNYPFYTDPNTDICYLYTYEILDVDTLNHKFAITGNQTQLMTAGRTFAIENSTANDGTYTIISSTYDITTNQTYITVNNISSSTVDGLFKLNYRNIPWITGDRVFLTTTETLPTPLIDETEYFIIVINNREFKLATTQADALANVSIDLTTAGRRIHYVGQLNSTFLALEGARTQVAWKHYEIDRASTLSLTLPSEISGIQTIINIVDGYDAFQYDQGWRINDDGSLKDPVFTARVTNWQLELERFIDHIHTVRSYRNKPPSILYEITLDPVTNSFTFANEFAQFLTGDPVTFSSNNTILPPPLISRIKYYAIRTSLNTFKIAATKADAINGVEIDIEDTGSPTYATLWVTPFSSKQTPITKIEINPFRNGIWFRPQHGIVSNILTGPADDIQSSQLVFDQYGRPLGKNNIRVLRSDEQTFISVPDNIFNDVELTSVVNNPYNYLHLGGIHLFVDTHEHVLQFNNYTTEQQLLYDPFVGLNVTKFELQFRNQTNFTQRPNVGGYYLSTFYNQDAALKRNIEASIEDLRYLYDTYVVPETETLILNSRKAIGYEGTRDYFNSLNIGPKSQFIFWKGMIQQKGSLNAIKSFINSRRFLDAKVDEFWAVKLADFGAAGDKEYPELFITTEDARSNDIRFEFVADDDLCLPGYAVNVFDQDPCGYAYPEDGEGVLVGSDGFTPVTLSDETRWHNQPDQLEMLRNNGNTMFFTMKPITSIPIHYTKNPIMVEVTMTPGVQDICAPSSLYTVFLQGDYTNTFLVGHEITIIFPDGQETHVIESTCYGNNWTAIIVDGIINTDITHIQTNDATGLPTDPANNDAAIISENGIYKFMRWNASTLGWEEHGFWDSVTENAPLPTIRHGLKADAIELTLNIEADPILDREQIINGPTTNNIILQHAYIPFASNIKVFKQFRASIINVTPFTYGSPVSASFARATIQLDGDYSTLVEGDKLNIIDTNGVTQFTATVQSVMVAGSPNITTITIIEPLIDTQPDGSPIYGSPSFGNLAYVTFGRELISGEEFAETLSSDGGLLSNLIQIVTPLTSGEFLRVVMTPATLAEDIHYTVINSDIIQLSYPELYSGVAEDDGSPVASYKFTSLRLWGFTQDDNTQDPAKIIDVVSETVVTPVVMWDPARGMHYHNAIHNIDLLNKNNPARYNNTIIDNQPIEPGERFTRVVPSVWNKEQVGTTWLDTGTLEYVRYYDRAAITDLDTRLGYWGRAMTWSNATVYEWVESDVHPSQWNALAQSEENDGSLPEDTRKAGRIYPQLFKTNRDGDSERYRTQHQDYDIAIDGTPILEGMPEELIGYSIDIADVTLYEDLVFPAAVTSSGNAANRTFVVDGDMTSQFFIGDGIFYHDLYNEQYGYPTIDSNFTISNVVYDIGNDNTTITVQEPVSAQFNSTIIEINAPNVIVLDGDMTAITGPGAQIVVQGMEDSDGTYIVSENLGYSEGGGFTQIKVVTVEGNNPNFSNDDGRVTHLGIESAVINDGGTDYVVGDIIKLIGVGSPAIYTIAQLKVTAANASTGEIEAVEIYTPGNFYNGSPITNVDSISVIGNGTGATFDITFVTPVVVRGSAQITMLPSYIGTIESTEDDAFKIRVFVNGIETTNFQLDFNAELGSPSTYKFVLTLNSPEVKFQDHITVVRELPSDDRIQQGVASGALREEYEYTSVNYYDEFGRQQTKYYFWVQDKVTKRSSRTLSPVEAQRQFVSIPIPYLFFQRVRRPTQVFVDGIPQILPLRFSQTIIRGLRGIINANRRYVLRFTRDYTLRDSLEHTTQRRPLFRATRIVSISDGGGGYNEGDILTVVGGYGTSAELTVTETSEGGTITEAIISKQGAYVTAPLTTPATITDGDGSDAVITLEYTSVISPQLLQLKNKHAEWELIREEQPSKIRRELWDKITESIIGTTLSGNRRVPSLTRELYDIKYEADTQYGLGRDQSFANGGLALAAVLSYLTNPNNDFRPIDINAFFQDHSFDTIDNTINAMNRIYDAFAAIHVNKIFFSVLHNAAFSQKTKYADLFKTSMVALHGIKPLQVGGVFDD